MSKRPEGLGARLCQALTLARLKGELRRPFAGGGSGHSAGLVDIGPPRCGSAMDSHLGERGSFCVSKSGRFVIFDPLFYLSFTLYSVFYCHFSLKIMAKILKLPIL